MDIVVRQAPPMELGDYLTILRRRKVQLIVPFCLILVVGLGVAFGLPPVYRSEATILVERQEIPSNLVNTTVTGYVQERIQSIKQRIVTYSNLWEIAEKLDLYPEERRLENRSQIVTRMRDNILVEMVDVKASDPDKSGSTVATVAFTISFSADKPEVAQRVADELAKLYLEENRRDRKERTVEVSRFLAEEADKLSRQIAELEAQLAAFKQENMSELPELSNVNLRLLEQTEAKLERTEEQIRSLEQQQLALQAQLAVTNPSLPVMAGGDRLLTPEERLTMLQSEYLSKSSIYSSNHPDLARMRREIEVLQNETGRTGGPGGMIGQLEALRLELAEVSRRYSQEHPDVKRLENSIAALEEQMRNASSVVQPSRAPDNPQYVGLQSQLSTVAVNLKAEREKRSQLEEKLAEYEARLFRTPAVERDYLVLSRDYDNALKKYREIKEKQLQAGLAEQLERDEKGERFTLVGPASLPGEPEKPNRLGIALLGFTLAFGGGIGSACIAEYFDRTIRGFRGVAAILHAPPLAEIPYIQTEDDIVQKRSRRLTITFIITATMVLMLAFVNFYWKPLDQLWLELMQVDSETTSSQTTAAK